MTHADFDGNSQPSELSGLLSEDVLDLAIEEVLGNRNPYAYSVLSAIKRSLRQFRLSSRIEAYEILHEAYLRGKSLIRSGQTIRNPHAWLKATAFNIVREKYRSLKDQLTDPQLIRK
jgi:DNA-directed RNA polymerase specialized sigma24 family protein